MKPTFAICMSATCHFFNQRCSLLPSVPAWHCSPIAGTGCLHKPSSSTAQHPEGMVLICGTQKQYVCKINVHCMPPSDLLFIASVKHSQWPILLVICLEQFYCGSFFFFSSPTPILFLLPFHLSKNLS